MLASRAVGPLSQGAHGPAQLLGDHPDLGRLVTRDDENSRDTAAGRRGSGFIHSCAAHVLPVHRGISLCVVLLSQAVE